MLTLVIGGAASGKSAYAENLTLKHPLPRYYVATMQVWDEECAKRVEKHRAMRKEKQFETIESPISLDKIRIPNRGIVLLEDLGNLTANELYDPKGAGVNTAEAVLYGVEILYKQCEHLIVVSNEVFSGGAEYADETDLYLKALAQIQNGIAARADHVCRVWWWLQAMASKGFLFVVGLDPAGQGAACRCLAHGTTCALAMKAPSPIRPAACA